MISPSQKPLDAQHAINTSDEHPCLQRHSIPRSQQWSGRRPKHYTTRPPSSGYPNSKYLSMSWKLNVIIASQSVLFTT